MGLFSVSYQILNSQGLTKTQFKKQMNELMKKNGYVPAKEDEDGISFSFLLSSDKRWISFAAEEEDAIEVFGDGKTAVALSCGLNTYVIRTEIVDSDFAVFDLFNKNGEKMSSLILGDASGYIDESIQEIDLAVWKSVLKSDSIIEKMIKIKSKSYVFAEDAACDMAELSGIDKGFIVAESDEIQNTDTVIILRYKKKNKKTPSFNKRWMEMFLNVLQPYGFRQVKSKQPYVARMVGDDIVQVIGFARTPIINQFGRERKLIIYAGIETTFRKEINLDIKAEDEPDFLAVEKIDYNYNKKTDNRIHMGFLVIDGDLDSEKSAIINASHYVIEKIIPIFQIVTGLKSAIIYFQSVNERQQTLGFLENTNTISPENVWLDGLINFEAFSKEDFSQNRDDYMKTRMNYLKKLYDIQGAGKEYFDKRCKDICDYGNKEIILFQMLQEDIELKTRTLEVINNRKKINKEKLQKYGLYNINF